MTWWQWTLVIWGPIAGFWFARIGFMALVRRGESRELVESSLRTMEILFPPGSETAKAQGCTCPAARCRIHRRWVQAEAAKGGV